MVTLLSQEHSILEREFMEFRPFGIDERGEKIRDVTGVTICAIVEYLEESVTRTQGPEAGAAAVEELCRLLNARIRDPAYHVTPEFLKNVWNSYAYEFLCYVCEFGIILSKDDRFQENTAKEKYISSIIQTLGRPFTLAHIYRNFPHFGEKFASGSILFGVGTVTERSAVLRMKFTERVYAQFGPYRKRCANIICRSAKAGLAIVPARVHGLPPATYRDLQCIADGDEYCEWEFQWLPIASRHFVLPLVGFLTGGAAFAYLRLFHPEMAALEAMAMTVGPAGVSWLLTQQAFKKEVKARETLIHEQLHFVEARHEELREAYLEQQETTVALRQKVGQLTTLHRAGLLFASILDKEKLLRYVLDTLISELHYDRAMISFFDQAQGLAYDARLVGVPEDIAALARSRVVRVTDPTSIEGMVLLQGKPLLIGDVHSAWDRLDPSNQELALATNTKSLISVPLKANDKILGSLTVDRTKEHMLTDDDLNMVVTLASQIAIALDNTEAYHQIEALNVGLEAKIQARTAELESANEQLKALDRLKSEFFANISHELRTPLTLSLGAYRILAKHPTPSEARHAVEVGFRNTARLLVMINELLDLAKFDSGQMELRRQPVDFAQLVRSITANFEIGGQRRIHLRGCERPVPVEADVKQMKTVLSNMLSNARKFSDPERWQIWLRLSATDDEVTLEIEDNGIGIPSDQWERIFDRFTQVEEMMTRGHEGTGIGLALVKEILVAHGGSITVTSTVGQGSIFTIRFPRGQTDFTTLVSLEKDETLVHLPVASPSSGEEIVVSHPPADQAPVILVAEDNPDMRRYVESLLRPQYRVVVARDGTEALAKARAMIPALILTDVMMPKMSGYDVLKEIRRDQALQGIPVILLTARAGTDARIESLEAGADDYLAKPFDDHELLARVKNLIRAKEQERELERLRQERVQQFLPRPLAENVFAHDMHRLMKSRRAEITVLFVDLRGFTAFSDRAGPEDIIGVLRDYQHTVGTQMATFGATLERFSGDSIMAFFDESLSVQEQASRAVRLALSVKEQLLPLCATWQQCGYALGVGIGISTGLASLGLVGFEQRMDYAAIGPVTNLAARLCQEARHGHIYVPERVMSLVNNLACTEKVGFLELKGFHQPVLTYNVTGFRLHPTHSSKALCV